MDRELHPSYLTMRPVTRRQPSRPQQYYSNNHNIVEVRPLFPFPPKPTLLSSRFMQIVHNKSMLTQGPQVLAAKGRSHCRGNYSLHGMVMKAFFIERSQLGSCPQLCAALPTWTLPVFIYSVHSRIADTPGTALAK